MIYYIYNLEFPQNRDEILVGGYKVQKLPNYNDHRKKLMWLTNVSDMDGEVHRNTGINEPTAIVHGIGLKSKYFKGKTLLEDICLLLTIFTGRNVFALDQNTYFRQLPILADPRLHHYGGVLHCSLRYQEEAYNEETLEAITEAERNNDNLLWNVREIGFETEINKILRLIYSKRWRKKYKGGYFILLMRQALKRMDLEPTFQLCWTIWEHIYAVLNPKGLTQDKLEKVAGKDKISYLLKEYFNINLRSESHRELTRINKARNSLVHFGRITNNTNYKEIDLFIRMTEFLVAKTLKLNPSNVFNTNEKMYDFLRLRVQSN